jgi:hypothetical protein
MTRTAVSDPQVRIVEDRRAAASRRIVRANFTIENRRSGDSGPAGRPERNN